VGLGALGIVVRLTLDTVPAFDVRQHVYENIPFGRLWRHFDEIMSAAYSVSLFTTWREPVIRQAWLKQRVTAGDDQPAPPVWMGGTLAGGPRNPVPGMPAGYCTRQLGIAGPSHERLPHFRLDFTPSAGAELQSEYLVPRSAALGAFRVLGRIAGLLAPVVQVCEIRAVAQDELWLSLACQRDSIAFHFTWIRDYAAVAPVIAELEQVLEPYAARPHWGKLFGTSPGTVRELYARADDFRVLLRRYDPAGKFRNGFLDRYFPA
jgi:xylitol oxidase